jgi:hypothetical protein
VIRSERFLLFYRYWCTQLGSFRTAVQNEYYWQVIRAMDRYLANKTGIVYW